MTNKERRHTYAKGRRNSGDWNPMLDTWRRGRKYALGTMRVEEKGRAGLRGMGTAG